MLAMSSSIRRFIAVMLFIILLVPHPAYLPFSGSAAAADTSPILITGYYPESKVFVGNEFRVAANVNSTYEIKQLYAEVETAKVDLTQLDYPFCTRMACYYWTGQLRIAGLSKGEKKVTITAVDSRGNRDTKSFQVVYDEKPVIQIASPANKAVATPMLRIQASCTDDDAAVGCTSLKVRLGDSDKTISGVDRIDEEVSLASWDGGTVRLVFTAMDSKGQEKIEQRDISIDSSDKLSRMDTVDGEKIFDISPDRILYAKPDKDKPFTDYLKLEIKNRLTGQVTPIPALPDKAPDSNSPAYLTPHGAIFVSNDVNSHRSSVVEWRDGQLLVLGRPGSIDELKVKGNYALFAYALGDNTVDGYRLVLRNLVSGTDQEVFPKGRFAGMDVTANGEAVFSATLNMSQGTHNIYKWSQGTLTQITNDTANSNINPLTDGNSIVYARRIDPKKQAESIVVQGPAGSQTLSTFDKMTTAGADYQINQGWVAFTKEGSNGIRQVWVQAPDGTKQQVSDLGSDSTIVTLTSRGDVVFNNYPSFIKCKLYLSENPVTGRGDYAYISSTLLKPLWLQGKWIGTINSTMFTVRTGAADVTPPTWPESSRLDASDVTSNSVRLSWNAPEDDKAVTGYKLYKGTELIATVTGTTYDVGGLSPATSYRFKVEAGDEAGNWSTTGPVVDITTKPVPAADTTPPTVAAVSPHNGQTVYTSSPNIIATVIDAESGVDPASIVVKLAGKPVPAQYVPAASTIVALTGNVPNGTLPLTIDAADQAGNRMPTWTGTIRVSVENDADGVTYLALGDSLAAGFSPTRTIGLGYADFLAQNLRESGYLNEFVKNYAVPGYTTAQVLADIRNNAIKDGAGIGLKANIRRAGVITLDAGANDLIQLLEANGYTLTEEQMRTLFGQVSGNLTAILAEIRQLNAAAPVYLMGYYNAFHNAPLPPEKKEALLQALDVFNGAIAGVAQQAGAVFVPTKDAIAADYGTYLPTPDIHPSVEGYQAIAKEFWKAAQPSYLWPRGSALTATEVTDTSLKLTWSPAGAGTAAYRVYQNGTELRTVTGNVYSLDVTGLAKDTTYTFKVEASPAAGVWTKNGPAVTVKTGTGATDTTPPVISGVFPANGQTVTVSNPHISAVITDNGTGVDPASVTVKVDNQSLSAGYDGAAHTVTAAAYGLANGNHTLLIRAADLAGNWRESSSRFLVDVGQEETPGWPQGSALNVSKVTASSVTLSWNPAIGVVRYGLYQNGSRVQTVADNVYSATLAGLQPDTAYTFKIEAELKGGGWTTDGPRLSVKTSSSSSKDTTAPVIADVAPANGATVTTATPAVSAKITDAGSGVKPDSVKIKVGDRALKATYDAATSTVTAATYSLANGSYTLQIDAEDQAGNKAESKTTFTVSVGSTSTCCSSFGWGGGAASTPEGTFTKQQIEELIKKAGDTPSVTIETGESHEVTLPKEVGELLRQADKTLNIAATGASVDIPASVLSALAKLAGNEATIKVRLTPVDPAAENELIQAAGRASGAAVRIGGSFYDIALVAVEKDGTERRLSGFDQPVTLTLNVNTADTELPLVGVYSLNEQQQRWEYEGGEASTEGKIRVALRHTSKYAVLEYKKSYADVAATHWAHRYIQALSAKHIAEGVSGDKYAPEQLVTRAEFVALLVRALGLPQASADKPLAYGDVEANAWYYSAVASAVHAGLVQGTDSTRFAPDARITREQMAVLLVRAFEHKKGAISTAEGKLYGYADEGDISAWAKAGVNQAIGAGLMEGRENGKFVPTAQTTRAEATTVIYKLLQK
ncbi:S-layer homology domain-containing protein [Paenibacillus ehimensis]|uniref:fibronectin type III domain-containing protein n=1 Tax=Paenibacillus ehimensis TaxID=79264 RepID=UPI002DBCE72D|nr:S-layer homology domain-containing protein [Paenibacillus ehimensis]MEC0208891.1 S-layer homology domain-containing protein [Paenibacillus ehimensis]